MLGLRLGTRRLRVGVGEGQQPAEADVSAGEAEPDRRDVAAAGHGSSRQGQLDPIAPTT
jgi:hypothetical protein